MPNENQNVTLTCEKSEKQIELSLPALWSEISKRESDLDEVVRQSRVLQGNAVSIAIRQGRALLLAKARVKQGEWEAALAEHFPKSQRTAERYMELATEVQKRGIKFFEDAKDVAGAFRLLGMLPEVEHKQIEIPTIANPPIFRYCNSLAEWVNKEGDEFIKSSTEELRVELRQRIKVVLEFYERLIPA